MIQGGLALIAPIVFKWPATAIRVTGHILLENTKSAA
jgi:hypothetical protein